MANNVVKVRVTVEGSIDKALRQFKKKCTGAGIFRELRRRAFYEKPSEVKRRLERRKEKVIQSFAEENAEYYQG